MTRRKKIIYAIILVLIITVTVVSIKLITGNIKTGNEKASGTDGTESGSSDISGPSNTERSENSIFQTDIKGTENTTGQKESVPTEDTSETETEYNDDTVHDSEETWQTVIGNDSSEGTEGETAPSVTETEKPTETESETPTEIPSESESTGQTDATEETGNTDKEDEKSFKIIGYMPDWRNTSKLDSVHLDKYTHINYAFAIPKSDGTIRDLPDEEFVDRLIKTAHENGVKVLLSLGGWSYGNEKLSPTFAAATKTAEKREKFSKSFLDIALRYGFDGLDLDWEYPEKETAVQYEEFVTILRGLCDENSLLLTCAVVGSSNMTAAFTDKAAACFDWMNVMCYDGGEGADHSPMSLVRDFINYWTETRNIPSEKLTVGVPFYSRPYGDPYRLLIEDDVENAHRDLTEYEGNIVYYNGIETMEEKTLYALENAGGIMVWEMTQDTADNELSLICTICRTIEDNR